ncbi:trk system potassium uptake protein TrkA [Pelagirhabdus alkalitolerans]|uniref:Trk system potassium uptake protein TrkA n=1 Tax=Pelagirhabdus alkalitolerans TaxID=1612202 RepID=A0A1G6KKX2_9BACI|nr:TrkA family potassium uptake protein [Pelagirhabdus alkalitolerans]SDC31185.1 trk system potassium uptake protein TrkA [Pelagirhabdus alkalitolerans]
MAKPKQLAIIGLGQFGTGVAKSLIQKGHDVLVIDKNERLVNEFRDTATHAVACDATDDKELKALGIKNFDYVIVAIGENIQASILTTLILKDFDVKNVWVKSTNDYHTKILEKIDADLVIHPEQDTASRLVRQLINGHLLDYIELSNDYSIVEIKPSKQLCGETIATIDLRGKYGITLIGLKYEGQIDINPSPDYELCKQNVLILLGHKKDIARFKKAVIL